MSYCKDCLFYEHCYSRITFCMDLNENTGELIDDVETRYSCFKDRTKFIELPCQPLDIVYMKCLRKILKLQVECFVKYSHMVRVQFFNSGGMFCYTDDFGKTVFLTREEAEKALIKEREQK